MPSAGACQFFQVSIQHNLVPLVATQFRYHKDGQQETEEQVPFVEVVAVSTIRARVHMIVGHAIRDGAAKEAGLVHHREAEVGDQVLVGDGVTVLLEALL